MAAKATSMRRAALIGAFSAIALAVSPVSAACLVLPTVPVGCAEHALGTAPKLIACKPGNHFKFIIYADPFGNYHGIKQADVAKLPAGADVRFYYAGGAMERHLGVAPDNPFGRMNGVRYYRVFAKAPHGERWVRTPICR